MKVAVFPELGAWSASTRYRVVQFLPLLADRLGTVDLFLPDDRPSRHPGRIGQARFFGAHAWRYGRRWQEVRRTLPRYDAVLVQRGFYPLGPGQIAGALRSYPGRVVLDLDDAVFEVKPSVAAMGGAARWLYGPQQARRTLERADAVVVSSALLGSSLPRQDVPVHLLPTVPDPRAYAVADHTRTAPRLVWAGTNGNLRYLDPLRPALSRLEADGVGSLTVVCSEPWSGPSTFRRWQAADEYAMFAEYAVGIMPLPDTPFTRGKAGFKLLQYMAAGLPVVASPVGVNRELVTRSGAGFLAETEQEWHDRLAELLADPALRARLGDNGRRFVMGYADLEGQADLLASLLSGSSD